MIVMAMKWYENESLIKFETPCTITLIAPSNGGKTYFVKRLLEHADGMFANKFSKILYCYSAWQNIYNDMLKSISNISFNEGIPSQEELNHFTKEGIHSCLVLDDLAGQINSNPKTEQWWTVQSHHSNLSILYLAHNLFPKSVSARTISLNTNYFILFKNHRDKLQIQHFARQVYPHKSKFFLEAFHSATSKQWGYLVVDLHNLSNDRFRLRTSIFPNEDSVIFQAIST